MRCDDCGTQEAVVHLTQVEGLISKTLHLCDACARSRGIQGAAVPENLLLAGVLAELSLGEGAAGSLGEGLTARSTVEACPFCALTLRDFKQTGRLGCPHCWTAFETQLRPLLNRVQGGHQHTGKVYLSPDPSASEREKRLEGLRRKLDRAVQMEDFERAAELRDRIRTLQSEGGAGAL
jgi:protein arginine kinase activator